MQNRVRVDFISDSCITKGLEVISLDILCDSDCAHVVYNWNDCSDLTRLHFTVNINLLHLECSPFTDGLEET
jgi:hypothetical protein